jgi:hypothetical protein
LKIPRLSSNVITAFDPRLDLEYAYKRTSSLPKINPRWFHYPPDKLQSGGLIELIGSNEDRI